MTDQNFHEELRATIRDAVASYLDTCTGEELRELATESLLPSPPRPTLADMTEDERDACQWMQADVADHNTRYVIANPDDGDGEVALIAADGRIEWIFPEYVTPRPDLPRWEWPGTEKPAPTLPEGWRLADHKDHGRVIVTNPTPDPSGHVYYVLPAPAPLGYDWLFCGPDRLTYLDQEDDTSDAVPESTLSVGTVIESADDPRIADLPLGSILLDRDEEATTKRSLGWTGLGNAPNEGEGDTYGPWTVLHIPKEDDQ